MSSHDENFNFCDINFKFVLNCLVEKSVKGLIPQKALNPAFWFQFASSERMVRHESVKRTWPGTLYWIIHTLSCARDL